MEAKIYNQKGKEVEKIELPESVFDVSWNPDLVHQVMMSMRANERSVIAHTKGRGEVSGTGKKPWKQKGTGRARHGSKRSPIWVGGGITFGPTNERNFSQKINKKMSVKALYTVLSQKLRDGEILFVDNLNIKEPKTKEAKEIFSSLSRVEGFGDILKKRKNSTFITTDSLDENIQKSFNNLGNVEVGEIRNLNIMNLLGYKYLVVSNPEKIVESLSAKTLTK